MAYTPTKLVWDICFGSRCDLDRLLLITVLYYETFVSELPFAVDNYINFYQEDLPILHRAVALSRNRNHVY